jgi:hypothetical protein
MNNENVIWKPVVGYESKYEISNTGIVRSLNFNKTKAIVIMKEQTDRYGYSRIGLSGVGKQKYTQVHRIVALAFIINTENLSCVNHIDGNKKNNNVTNLEWCSNIDNLSHALKTGLMKHGEKHGMAKLTIEQVIEIKLEIKKPNHLSQHKLAKKYGVSRGTISGIIYGKNWINVLP